MENRCAGAAVVGLNHEISLRYISKQRSVITLMRASHHHQGLAVCDGQANATAGLLDQR